MTDSEETMSESSKPKEARECNDGTCRSCGAPFTNEQANPEEPVYCAYCGEQLDLP